MWGPQIPEIKDELFVSIGTIEAFGKVAWVEHPEFGVAFDPPLPAETIEALREQVKKGAGLSPEEKAAIDVWVLGILTMAERETFSPHAG